MYCERKESKVKKELCNHPRKVEEGRKKAGGMLGKGSE